MDGQYHWPDEEAVRIVSAMLELPVQGTEQDWEIEMADPSRLAEMATAFRDGSLDLECRSALALLILHSAASEARSPRDRLIELKAMFAADEPVLMRMREYWSYFQPSHRIRWLLAPA